MTNKESQSEESRLLKLVDLVQKGYFPKELPPPFTTKSFANNLTNILSNKKIIEPNEQKIDTSKCSYFTIPNKRIGRRKIEIPNPLQQLRLSKTIVKEWPQIVEFTTCSPLSMSKLEILPNSTRAISPYRKPEKDDYFGWSLGHEIRKKRIEVSNTARHLLVADIANFYDTIYTHSIPWALHTKKVAKKNRKDSLIGNLLDKQVMKCRDGQTSGIPVGPDTSRIISEIVATAIDIRLAENINTLRGVRFYDDYYLYFRNMSELETSYSSLQDAVRDYELSLNLSKVQKLDIKDESLDKLWVNKLRKFQFRVSEHPITEHNDLIHYFDLSFQLAQQYPNDSVIHYAIQRISNQHIDPENLGLFVNLLLRSLQIDPKPVHIVSEIFLRKKRKLNTLLRL